MLDDPANLSSGVSPSSFEPVSTSPVSPLASSDTFQPVNSSEPPSSSSLPPPASPNSESGPKQLVEASLPTESPLVFRKPEEISKNKPKKPFLIGGAILAFLLVSTAAAVYFIQTGKLSFQKKAAEGDLCTYGETCTVAGQSGTRSCTGTIQGGNCKYSPSVNPNCSACTYCGDGVCGGGEGADNCPADCAGGGGGGGITCGADSSGIWVKNNGNSATTVSISWFASYCEHNSGCVCSGGPNNETISLKAGETVTRGFTNSRPPCQWAWQTDVTVGSCHQSAHGCGSETCVSPTPTPVKKEVCCCPTAFCNPIKCDITRDCSGGLVQKEWSCCVGGGPTSTPTPTATPTPLPTGTGTVPKVCCCWQGGCSTSYCQMTLVSQCTSPATAREITCCTASPPTSTPTPTLTPKPTATPTPTSTPTPTPTLTPTPTSPPACSVPVQISVTSAGETSTSVIASSSYGYTNVELRVTSGSTVTAYQNPIVQGTYSWLWTVPKSYASITAVAFYANVTGLGKGGDACGTWSPPVPTPTSPPLPACLRVQLSVVGGGDLSSLKIGDSLTFNVNFSGTVEDVGIVIKKDGVRVETLTAGSSQTDSWTSPAYTIESLGSYEVSGYVKVNGTWQ